MKCNKSLKNSWGFIVKLCSVLTWALPELIFTVLMVNSGFPHVFKNLFPYFLNTEWKSFNTITYLNFPKFYSWNTMQKTSAKLSWVVKNKFWINKWLNLVFSYFMYILGKFNTYSRSWKLISQFNTFNTAWKPCQPVLCATQYKLYLKAT